MHYLFLGLCSLLCVLSFFAHNTLETDLSYAKGVIYFLFLFGGSLTLWAALRSCFKKDSRFIAISVGLTCIFVFHLFLWDAALLALLKEHYRYRYFLISSVALISLIWGLSFIFDRKYSAKFSHFIALSVLLYTAFDGFSVLQAQFLQASLQKSPPNTTTVRNAQQKNQRNVYYIVPDMMLGPEMVQTLTGKPLELISYLKKRNFLINENAYSNAPVTTYSLSHVLSMKYPLNVGPALTDKAFLHFRQSHFYDNPVFQTFKKNGYQVSALSDGYVSFCSGYEDVCIRKKSLLTLQDFSFIDRSRALTTLDNLQYFSTFIDTQAIRYPSALEIQDIIPLLTIKPNSSVFTMLHIGLPHFPFRFHADCTKYNGDAQYFKGDKLKIYDEQLQCANQKYQLLIDHLIQEDPDAIILFQSDHGTFTHNQGHKPSIQLTQAELRENFNIVSAYRLPEECQHLLPKQTLSPVNSFRLIFSCLTAEPTHYEPHQSFVVYYPLWKAGKDDITLFDPYRLHG